MRDLNILKNFRREINLSTRFVKNKKKYNRKKEKQNLTKLIK